MDRIPEAKHIPDLDINVEGLKRHCFTTAFIPEPSLSQDVRKLRSWLLHTVAIASRHYLKAREFVHLQNTSDQIRDGGAIFYIFEVSEQIEGCVMAMHRVCMALRRLTSNQPAKEFVNSFEGSIGQLSLIRNQFEHMHCQIVASETGSGPISIVFGGKGQSIRFRKLSMETARLHALIEGAFRVVAGLYPAFDANSAREAGGPIKLTITASVEFIETNGNRMRIE